MQISIDPSNEPAPVLRALATMLTTLASECDALVAKNAKVAAADNPSTGRHEGESAANIIAAMEKRNAEEKALARAKGDASDLAAAFGGAGNVVGASAIAPSPPPALIGAILPTIPGLSSDLAAAFGGNGPNVALGAPAPIAAPAPLVPSPSAGTPPAPGNGTAMAGVDTDTDGLPWNDKIHSSNQKKGQDGKWMRRRNVTDDTRRAVEAQLRAAMSVPVGNVQAPAGVPPPPPVPTPMAIPLPETTPGTAVSNIGLPQLLPRITSAMSAGHLTADTAAAIAMELSDGKINNVAMLAIAPHLIPAFWARLDQLGVA